MTIARAIEILTPDTFVRFSPAEYDEALAMACAALIEKKEKEGGDR